MTDEKPKIVLPDGAPSVETPSPTDRTLERAAEDEKYTPVIVKRTDEARRHPDDTLEHAILEGLLQLQRPAISLFLSSMSAGLILGLSIVAVAIVTQILPSSASELSRRLATACVYPLGFIISIMSGSQLFTEHTATAVYPVLDRRASWGPLLRLRLIVISGNLVGTALSASFLAGADSVIQATPGYEEIAHRLVQFGSWQLFLSAILAGWLMAQGAWLVLSTSPPISQMVSIYLVTFLIGIGGLHHSIAGSAEIFLAAMVSPRYALADVWHFIPVALLGNLAGGSTFVGILNYAHIRHTQRKTVSHVFPGEK